MAGIEQINYPAKKYLGLVKSKVNLNLAFEVRIDSPKHQALLEIELPFLLGTQRAQPSIGFILRWAKLANFLAGHFYAASANYSVTTKKAEVFTVIYEPANKNGTPAI